MPRDERYERRAPSSTRLTQPGPGAGTVPAPAASLVSLLANAGRPTDVLSHLHLQAVERTGGRWSILVEQNPRDGTFQATSAFKLETLRTDPWEPDGEELAIVNAIFDGGLPVFIGDVESRLPDLAARVGPGAVLLLPLTRAGVRVGLLVIGVDSLPASDAPEDAVEIADAFVAALELVQLRQRTVLLQDLRALLQEFSDGLSATLSLAAGLDIFCHGASRLFGADRTSVWLHERRARQLVLQASSDPDQARRGVRIAADDASAPAAMAMRRTRAELTPRPGPGDPGDEAATAMLTVPLRGTRRALGTIVFEGVRAEPGGELDLLDRADEVGRQLSNAIENMQLLENLIQSRRELENTFDSITHLVAVADRRGYVTHVNRAFAGRIGRPREEILNKPIAELVGPELAGWITEIESMEARPHGELAATRQIFDPMLHGPFMVTVTDLRNQDRDWVGSVIVARDLTPQTRLEAEREELRRRLTQSEKLAALGQFVAGIAHELNNPLQGVLGHLELLRVTGAFPKQIRREVQTIYREADRAAKIVRNLLVFAGSRRLAPRAVSVNTVLQRVLALRTPACRVLNIDFVRHYDDKLPRVHSDPLLLHQVFLNMVMNAEHAIAATGRGGRIEVTTAVAPARDRVIATVRDTGTGISEETLSRIFEPFYTTKEVGKGTGLGLAIAYGIVQEHGGQIIAANHAEGGAVFTVELPAAPSRRERSA